MVPDVDVAITLPPVPSPKILPVGDSPEQILESEAFLIGDIDTGIGFYGDLNLVDTLSQEEKEEQENEKLDDEYRDEALDTDQLVEDEEENEDMGDEDVQYTQKDN